MSAYASEKVTGYHWLLFLICFISTALAGTVSALMSVYLPVVVREFLGDRSADDLNYLSAYINSIFIFGGAAGGFLLGIIGDKWGRKKAVLFAIACYGLFAVLTGYAPTWWGVVICRFFSGFGLGGVLVTTTTLMVEEWPKKSRAIFLGILSISIPVGIVSAGLIDYVVKSWRQGFLVGIIPMAISIISIWLLRESAKWKYNQAEITQGRANTSNLFSIGHRRNVVIGSLIFGTMLISLWASFSWLPTWIQSLLPGNDTQKERGLSMMMLGMGGLTGGFISGWLTNAVGARKALIGCFSACAILSFVLFKTNPVFSPVIYPEIALLTLFFGAGQGVLSVYIPELFPVNIRSTATGFCFNIGRLFTATAVLFVGVLVSALGGYGNALFIFSLILLAGLAVTLVSKKETVTLSEELTTGMTVDR